MPGDVTKELLPTEAAENTDREIWRRVQGDYYSPSIFATQQGAIGLNVGGLCIVKSVEDWHSLARIESTRPSATSGEGAFTPEAVERASAEVARLQRELDITNADHIALWIEANMIPSEPMSQCVSWFACRIVEAYEAAINQQRRSFGFLPGNYSIRCVDCGKQADGCAKLSIRCAACADAARLTAPSGEGRLIRRKDGTIHAENIYFHGLSFPEISAAFAVLSGEGRSTVAGEDAVEVVARALFVFKHQSDIDNPSQVWDAPDQGPHPVYWVQKMEHNRPHYRDMARAALAALSPQASTAGEVGLNAERKAVLQNPRVNDAIQTALERGELTVTMDGYLSALNDPSTRKGEGA